MLVLSENGGAAVMSLTVDAEVDLLTSVRFQIHNETIFTLFKSLMTGIKSSEKQC